MMTKIDKFLQGYHFSNELGERMEFTPSQKEIMSVILNLGAGGKQFVQIETPTRFGKSASVAAALVMRCTKKEQWAIVAGTADKAQIIMDYFINYALENEMSRELLKGTTAIDKLKQDRSRRHLSFSSGFEVRVFTTDSRNKQKAGEAVMGFGSPFVILDEAALVDDVVESKVFRMIAGFSTTKHLYIKIGNPFFRNHFYKSSKDPDFYKIHFDYKVGIDEGRYTAAMIEKARSRPGFGVLYEVKFPDADAVDDKGWSPLLTEEDIQAVTVKNGSGFGFLKVGCDPSGEGTNFNSIVTRWRNYASIFLKERLLDQFLFTERLINYNNQLKAKEEMLPLGYYVDRVGIGEGYYQTMRLDLTNVHGVNVGLAPLDIDSFVNLRAEAYWRLREDIKAKRLHLEESEDWLQLTQIKYRTKLEGKRGKVEIMSKDEMRANGIESPDVADALMLTYVHPDPIDSISAQEYNSSNRGDGRDDQNFDRYGLINEI